MRAKQWGTLELSLIAQKAEICIWQMQSKHPATLLSLVLNKLQTIPSLTVQTHTGNSNTEAGKIPFGQGHLLQQWPEALNINYSNINTLRLLLTHNTDTKHRGLFFSLREREISALFCQGQVCWAEPHLVWELRWEQPRCQRWRTQRCSHWSPAAGGASGFSQRCHRFLSQHPHTWGKRRCKIPKTAKKKGQHNVFSGFNLYLCCRNLSCASGFLLVLQTFVSLGCREQPLWGIWGVCSGVSHSQTKKFSHKIHKQRQNHLATDWEVITRLSSWSESLWSNTPSVYRALCLLQTAFLRVFFYLLLWFIGF